MPTDLPDAPKKETGKRAFTSEPHGQDWKDIKAKRIEPTYQCSRCNRTHRMENVQIVLLQGKYYCLDHYRDARLELAYADPAFADEWQEQELAKIMAKHPEWQRQADESRTEYQQRMMKICNQKLRQLKQKVAA